MTPSIVIIGCFDTKGAVFAFLRDCFLAKGESVIMVNTGVMETTVDFPIDYQADTIATAAGYSLAELQTGRDRGQAIQVMGTGAAILVSGLVQSGLVKAAMGMGGGGGTFMALTAMQAIPFGTPKLCLSTLAVKDLSRQVGCKDIVLMPSVVDIADLNSLITPLIEQAAAALCAMATVRRTPGKNASGRIAVSMFGNTTPCVEYCTDLLKKLGYDVLAFHANGVGGRTMEALIREGCFEAVLDITTTELADELCGGSCSAGPDRLLAAARMGVPQVVVPGCLDMVNFGHPDTVPARFSTRDLYGWAPDVTLMRTNATENEVLGNQLAQKVNQSRAAATVVLPLRGISQLDSVGQVFYQPRSDRVLFEAIRQNLLPHVKLLESAAHINDRAFAELLVANLLAIVRRKQT